MRGPFTHLGSTAQITNVFLVGLLTLALSSLGEEREKNPGGVAVTAASAVKLA
jgi:hypothetical protein